jgi:hypothetical protein
MLAEKETCGHVAHPREPDSRKDLEKSRICSYRKNLAVLLKRRVEKIPRQDDDSVLCRGCSIRFERETVQAGDEIVSGAG